jgi:hypothetical protein
MSVALILGDGIYNFIKIMACTVINIHGRMKKKGLIKGNIYLQATAASKFSFFMLSPKLLFTFSYHLKLLIDGAL